MDPGAAIATGALVGVGGTLLAEGAMNATGMPSPAQMHAGMEILGGATHLAADATGALAYGASTAAHEHSGPNHEPIHKEDEGAAVIVAEMTAVTVVIVINVAKVVVKVCHDSFIFSRFKICAALLLKITI